MSAINGDKSRFHRDRKSKIARRARKRKLLSGPKEQPKATPVAAAAKASL
jgi:hypothetical protein